MDDAWSSNAGGTALARPRHSTAVNVLPVVSGDADAHSAAAAAAHALGGHDSSSSNAPSKLHDDLFDDSEAMQLNETYLWLLVLATAGECVTTCFVPQWSAFRAWRLNVSATLLNFVGPFLDGLTYGYEDLPKTNAPSIACLQFRSAFLGVFTSFPFMVDHAGDLSASNGLYGPLYIGVTMLGACVSFHAGRRAVAPIMGSRVFANSLRSLALSSKTPSLLTSVTAFILLTTFTAAFGPKGFVRDPKDPQFIGALRVADGEELFLGIFMSCSAILLSAIICERLKPTVTVDALGSAVAVIDWGSIACNAIACVLMCGAYAASQLSPDAVQHNLLVLKFASSFCGSLSCFSASISHAVRRWQAGDRQGARWNLALHGTLALLFMLVLSKHERR